MAMSSGKTSDPVTADVVVGGGGAAGLTAAIAFAQGGLDTILAARRADAGNRTTALLAGSVKALDALGVWADCRAHAAPLRKLRIVDDTGRLLRAPEVCFTSEDVGLDAFGYNIENRRLVAALLSRTTALPALRLFDANVRQVSAGGRRADKVSTPRPDRSK